MLEERRQHPRLVPAAPMFVSLDASKSGLLLDVCSGGIALASLLPRQLDDVIALEFELPEGCGRVSANAEIAWTRDDGHLSGARFLDLDEGSRAHLSRWMGGSANFEAMASGISESANVLSEMVEAAVEEPEIPGSEVAALEFVDPEFVEPEPEKTDEQASLFHAEPLAKRPEPRVETHPVDSYFLEPPKKEDELQERSVTSEAVEASCFEELTLSAATDTNEQDDEQLNLGNTEDIDSLSNEVETANCSAEHLEAHHDNSNKLATEIDPEAVYGDVEPADELARHTVTPHPAAIETDPSEQGDLVFVTRSTYVQPDESAIHEDEAQMHLQRAAVFHLPAGVEGYGTEQTTELAVQPWQMPRPAGLQFPTESRSINTSEMSRPRHTIELILAVVVLSWALVFLGYQMGSSGVSRENSKEADATSAAAISTDVPSKGLVPSVEAASALTQTRSPSATNGVTRRETATRQVAKGEMEQASTLGDPGMVLQVGAMKREDNADILARQLQKKNLPAFVFRHGPDYLYRVAVGPFSNEQATDKAKSSLEKQGLKPILRRWLPQ